MDIKNHEERDAEVKDYVATVKRLQQRYEDEKTAGIFRRRDIEEQFQPIVKSQDKMTKKITEALKPVGEEISNLREGLEAQEHSVAKKQRLEGFSRDDGPQTKKWKLRLLTRDKNLDTTFGIRYTKDGDQAMIARTPVILDHDDIIIDGKIYEGTSGLWSLITDTKLEEIVTANPTEEDYHEYADILYQTNALHDGYDPDTSYPRSSHSDKWKKVLAPIWRNRKKVEGSGLKHPFPGCRLYLQKKGHCCVVQTTKNGKGLYLSPTVTASSSGDGLYIKAGSTLYDARRLLLEPPEDGPLSKCYNSIYMLL